MMPLVSNNCLKFLFSSAGYNKCGRSLEYPFSQSLDKCSMVSWTHMSIGFVCSSFYAACSIHPGPGIFAGLVGKGI